MTVTTGKTTGPEAPGIKAAQTLHAKYVEAGDAKSAKVVAETANLFHNVTFPEAKADDPKPEKVDSAEINGQAVDLSGMTTTEAEEYQAYVAELDGSARLQRHIARMEADDEEDRRLGIGAHNDGS